MIMLEQTTAHSRCAVPASPDLQAVFRFATVAMGPQYSDNACSPNVIRIHM